MNDAPFELHDIRAKNCDGAAGFMFCSLSRAEAKKMPRRYVETMVSLDVCGLYCGPLWSDYTYDRETSRINALGLDVVAVCPVYDQASGRRVDTLLKVK